MKPKNVLIVGGTHGNEWTGAYVVLKYSNLIQKEFPNLQIDFELGNPKAFGANLRFINYDLNRIFNSDFSGAKFSEACRANYLKKRIAELFPCLVIDLHTTTANMGSTLIITKENDLNLDLLACIEKARFVSSPDKANNLLISQSPYGMIVEIGPVHQNLIDLKAIKKTIDMIRQILKAISEKSKTKKDSIYLYREVLAVYYPTNPSGEIEAGLHENFLAQDFKRQSKKIVPFRRFTGELISMETNERLYPIFINESSYYAERLAFILCRKTKIFTRSKRKDASRG